MKAVIFADPAGTGGVETWVRDFLQFTSIEWLLLKPPPRRAVRSDLGLSTSRFVQVSKMMRNLVQILTVLERHRNSRHVFLVHKLGLATLAVVSLGNQRVIYFSHNNWSRQLETRGRLSRFVFFFLEKLVIRRCLAVYSFSTLDFPRMRQLRNDTRLLAGSYNDLVFFPRRTESRDEKRLLWAGRLAAIKNPLLAIEGFEAASREDDSLKLVIAGDGPDKSRLLARARRSVYSNRIKFLGSVSQTELAFEMSKAGIFLSTSSSEGAPRTIMEAIACGARTVCTDSADPEKWTERANSGLIVRDLSGESIGAAILRLLSSPKAIDSSVLAANAATRYFACLDDALMDDFRQASLSKSK